MEINVIKMKRIDSEIIALGKCLSIRKNAPSSVKRAKILAFKIDSNDFGKMEISYNTPKYMAENALKNVGQ